MTLFLTSSPCIGWAGDLNPANGFLSKLRKTLPHPLHCLMISSAPDDKEMTERMAWDMREIFGRADLAFDKYEVLDRRTQRYAARMICDANFIILCGGHVPTEHKFFKELHLRTRLSRFEGVIMGISAGSMNAADIVYAPPELDGESLDPKYKVYLHGLGFTDVNILPHFEMIRESWLDGRLLVGDIVARHSYSHPVYCLNDGTYLLITNAENKEKKRTELHGEAYRMKDGKLDLICHDGECKLICKNGSLRIVK